MKLCPDSTSTFFHGERWNRFQTNDNRWNEMRAWKRNWNFHLWLKTKQSKVFCVDIEKANVCFEFLFHVENNRHMSSRWRQTHRTDLNIRHRRFTIEKKRPVSVRYFVDLSEITRPNEISNSAFPRETKQAWNS